MKIVVTAATNMLTLTMVSKKTFSAPKPQAIIEPGPPALYWQSSGQSVISPNSDVAKAASHSLGKGSSSSSSSSSSSQGPL